MFKKFFQFPLNKMHFTIVSLSFTIIFLLIDLYIPLGVAAEILYIIPVLITFLTPSKKLTFSITIISTVFIIIGYIHSPHDGIFWVVLLNRLLSLFAIWVTTAGIIIQKYSNAKLKKNETRLSHLLSNSPAAIYICEAEGDFPATYVSENVYEIMGLKPSQFLEDPNFWTNNIHPEDAPKVFNEFMRLFEEGVYAHEYRFHIGNGKYIWIYDQQKLIYNEEGIPVEIVGYWADITQRKEIEIEIIKAKEIAEQANRAKSDFLTSMSHELRTPLNAILGFSEILELELKNQEHKENAGYVHKAGQYLLGLVNDILDLSAIESGKIKLSFEEVSIKQILEDCIGLIETLADKKKIRIINDISKEKDFYVLVNYTRFKQIILNLLSNAVKYNIEGGIITLECAIENQVKFKLTIKDTGKGLTQEQQSHLFKLFDRAGAENSGIEGTGIGLVLSKKLIEIMNGKIGFTSKMDKGSEFWLKVELVRETNIIKSTGSMLCPEPDTNTHLHSGKKILYIENDPNILKLITEMIATNTSHTTLSASDGLLGINLAKAHRPALILLDINLPIMSGYDVLKILQALEETSNIPVIAVTVFAMTKDIDKGIAAGFKEYITKPVDVKILLETLKRFV